MSSRHRAAGLGLVATFLAAPLFAAAPADDEAAFRALYKELIEINTTLSAGGCTKAAVAMRARLLAAGIPEGDATVMEPPENPNEGALIALLHGTDRKAKPLLLLAHIDVVEAKREDWERDPFKLVEEDGWFYARGASDDKAMAAALTDSLIRYKKEGFKPRRDIKLALTCGEETSNGFNMVRWLTQTKPEVLSAAFALNEGAGGELGPDGKPMALNIQAGEKVYQDFSVEATDVGGHSSRPTKTNPITRLSAALARLGAYNFPVAFNEATRGYFEAQTKLQPPAIAADIQAVLKNSQDEAAVERLWAVDPGWNGSLRTTCVSTQITGGHAPNALPQRARANINCRILPGVPHEEVRQQIIKVLADDKLNVTYVGAKGVQSTPPPLSPQIMDPMRKVAAKIWPGVPVVPMMATGGTDGRFLNSTGVPTYGMSGMFHDAEGSRAHGLNERIRVKSLLDGRRFLYEVVKLYANGKD
jgi:acetylornithine deacetylase/succinyl-diaminopimelate desuccinylase-like protein